MSLRSGAIFKYLGMTAALLLMIILFAVPVFVWEGILSARTPPLEPVSQTDAGMVTYYSIMNKESGKVVDVCDSSILDGIGMVQWSENSGSNQLWQFIDAGAGYYKIKNKHSGKLLDVGSGSKEAGVPIVQWYDHDDDSILWQKIDAGVDSGFYKLKNKKSGKLMKVGDNATEDGARIIQWDDDGDPKELWILNAKS